MEKISMHKYKLLHIIVIGFVLTGITLGQTEIKRYMIVRSTPSYTLQVNLNYNQSVLELTGTYNDDVRSSYIWDGQTFGSDKGYGANIVSKIVLGSRGNWRFNQSLAYNRILSYTFGDKTTLADHGKANYNAFTGALGMEYNFTPAHRFKIYAGGDLNVSMINGEASIWIENPGYGYQDSGTFTIKNSLRMGFGVNVGAEYLLNSNFGLNIGVKYQNLNLLLKDAKGTNTDTEFELRDADSPGLHFAGKKNFAFYSIIAGVNFYFGVTEKRYKLK